MQKIGFSHGVLYRVLDVYSRAAIETYKECSSDAIEVCCNKTSEASRLSSIAKEIKQFSFKSIHLPTDEKYGDNAPTIKLLNEIEKFYREIKADLILVHPDVVEDWTIFERYQINWAIENMDCRKKNYRSLGDLANFFSRAPDWKFVLDLNHCYSNDASMNLADDLIKHLRNNISSIHLSGYVDYHEPLFKTKQKTIIDCCKKLDVPIIIESTFDSIDDVKKEYEYITEYLKK
jgi:hypothetical protein